MKNIVSVFYLASEVLLSQCLGPSRIFCLPPLQMGLAVSFRLALNSFCLSLLSDGLIGMDTILDLYRLKS